MYRSGHIVIENYVRLHILEKKQNKALFNIIYMESGYIKLFVRLTDSKKYFASSYNRKSIESVPLISFSILFHYKCRTKPIQDETEVWQLNSEEDYKHQSHNCRVKRSCSYTHLQEKLLLQVCLPNLAAPAQWEDWHTFCSSSPLLCTLCNYFYDYKA